MKETKCFAHYRKRPFDAPTQKNTGSASPLCRDAFPERRYRPSVTEFQSGAVDTIKHLLQKIDDLASDDL